MKFLRGVSTAANKKSLVVDYNTLANEQQVIAFFLPEAPTEMLKIFDEVCVDVSTFLELRLSNVAVWETKFRNVTKK